MKFTLLSTVLLLQATTTTAFVIPTSRRQPVSSNSALFLADEINAYRKGLSQIHKSPDEVGENPQRVVECVFKFGGSSLANAERIDHVANLIKDQIQAGYRPRAVVCSAMGKTTNNLLSAGEFALGKYLMGFENNFWGCLFCLSILSHRIIHSFHISYAITSQRDAFVWMLSVPYM
jgi:hypothetical protein